MWLYVLVTAAIMCTIIVGGLWLLNPPESEDGDE